MASQWNSDWPKPKIAISRETTYVTGPLRENGYVDYVAALNRHCSEGVVPENNAAIALWQAHGPKGIHPKIRTVYFQMLGIAKPLDDGEYLLSFDEFLQLQEGWIKPGGNTPEDCSQTMNAYEPILQAGRSPWSAEEHPTVAALLERNARPLHTFVEGMKRSRFYSPLLPVYGERLLQLDWSFLAGPSREAMRQLLARAMLRIQQGKETEAWDDILACHRLARLIAQQPFFIDQLIASTIESCAYTRTATLAQRCPITSGQVARFLTDLQELPVRWTWRECWDLGERFVHLDMLSNAAAHGYECPQPPSDDQYDDVTKELLLDMHRQSEPWHQACKRLCDNPTLDWDEAFRCCNAVFDRIVAAFDIPTSAECYRALMAIENEIQNDGERTLKEAQNGKSSVAASPKELAVRFIRLWMGLNCGSFGNVPLIDCKSQTYVNLGRLALALAGYRHDHGAYPAALDELSPKYLAEIPQDPFSGDKLHYQLENGGYLLYSVGPNGKDDGGRNFNEENEDWSNYESATEEEKSWDDIAIHTSPPNVCH